MESTLEAYVEDHRIFSSDRNWLYPIFDLERVLDVTEYERSDLEVYDKVVGRAAAFLFIDMRIKHLYAGVLSVPARDILDSHNLLYDYNEIVERVECKTEEMLLDVSDLKQGLSILREYVKERQEEQ